MTTSQESDMNDDDEGMSTPTAENAERSMASMMSVRYLDLVKICETNV